MKTFWKTVKMLACALRQGIAMKHHFAGVRTSQDLEQRIASWKSMS